VLTAVILVVAVLALSLSLAFAGREADRPTIAQDSSTTLANPGTTQLTGGVTKLSAVEHVMQLVNLRLMWLTESVSSSTTLDQAALLEQAVDRGLITPSEISAGSAAESLTQGQYAVLLWSAFGSDWSATSEPGETAAIQGLRSAGVILEADGAFLADEALTIEVERLLLARMEHALRGNGSK
jgi:hypothetical protein